MITFFQSQLRGDVPWTRKPGLSTIRNRYRVIKAFTEFGSRPGRAWCKPGLFEGVRLPRAEPPQDFIQLTADELLTMVESTDVPRDRAFLAHLICTACRVGEVTSLKLGDVDLDNLTVYTRIHKSNRADSMPIVQDLFEEITRWLVDYQDRVEAPLNNAWYLYPAKTATYYRQGRVRAYTIRPDVEMQYMSARRIVRNGLVRIGYNPAGLTQEACHTIRRSVARLYFDSRMGDGYSHALRETQALLHHKSSATTEMYLRLDIDRARRDDTMKGKPFILGRAAQTRGGVKNGGLRVAG
ncbi:tyrosine-type recombinase/integrase [Parafrankia sp. EUN1f]|uniref:tyrosine-type recombinase/integrase n=1 Tax=Parafrankia sp. EUN1f TaxID=102897 RepID=UPI00350FDBD0